jgi:hypothetical protein
MTTITTARPDSQAAAARLAAPMGLPRTPRLGAAIASVIVSTLLLGSVVVGMTYVSDASEPTVAVVATSTRG